MAELRSVDPRTLQPNPNNHRRTPVPPAMDEQLLASIKAVGIIQPPCVSVTDNGVDDRDRQSPGEGRDQGRTAGDRGPCM
jgi:ParB-like chromosome segregation protein Spo0J